MSPDLSEAALSEALGERPVRAYPAIVSTESDALAWARAGAPAGAVVVADYQLAPRGRGGFVWDMREGEGRGFSLVTRPDLPVRREGWPYIAASVALAEVAGSEATLRWPDEIRLREERWASVAVHAHVGPEAVEAAVISVHLLAADPPRGPLLARVVAAIEAHQDATEERVKEAFLAR
jgi:BirA family transcriptional regulator, biotin operon repressor / biotin---[acetyl-CoA-carboxylase] ligase